MEVAAAVMAVGQVVQGVGGYNAGMFNAKAAKINAENALRDGAAEETDIREAERQALGEQVASQAAGGFALGVGSNVDVLMQSQVNAELDRRNARRRAAMGATGYRIEAANAKAGAYSSLIGGLTGAAGTIHGSMSNQSNQARIAGAPSALSSGRDYAGGMTMTAPGQFGYRTMR